MNPKRSVALAVLLSLALLALCFEAFALSPLTGKLNINTADAKQLNMLPGIGQSKADAIIKLRTQINGFKRLDDLLKVKGLGRKLYTKIVSYIKLDGQSDLALPKTPKASS